MVLSGLNGKQAAGNNQAFLTERLKTMLDWLLIDAFLLDKYERVKFIPCAVDISPKDPARPSYSYFLSSSVSRLNICVAKVF